MLARVSPIIAARLSASTERPRRSRLAPIRATHDDAERARDGSSIEIRGSFAFAPPRSRRAFGLAIGGAIATATMMAREATAAYGTAASDEVASEGEFTTFYGAANPPATYGSIGGTTKALAKYSYEVPDGWVEEATSKVEKGSGGQDSRFVKSGTKGAVKAYCLTLNPAGQDGASFALTEAALQAVAGALSDMQDSITAGQISTKRAKEDGREYALFEVDADRKYVVKISIDNTGRLFAFVVTAPASQFNRDKKNIERMANSFRVYSSVSQFV